MRSFLAAAAVAVAAAASSAAPTSSSGPRDQWRTEAELGQLPVSAVSQLPRAAPRYQMNQSTIIMPCNNSGYMDPQRTAGWSIIDFDWSNGKAIWTKQRPMLDEEVLQNQVKLSTSSSLGQTVWVYRGSLWAYPWYSSVRKTLEDPAYSDWYIKFKKQGPWFSKKCDAVNTTDCSDLYHCQEQSPAYPHGDGDCGAPNCDCGNNVPCGFYVWNHSSTTVVHGQTFQEWFRDTYIFDYQGTSPLVSGFYFDDWWPEPEKCCPKGFPYGMPPDNMICYNDSKFVKAGGGPCGSWCTHTPGTAPGCGGDSKHMCATASCPSKVARFPDAWPNMAADMGLTGADQMQISKSYQANMATVYAEILKRGMFSWQQQWNGQSSPTAKTGCCTGPLVRNGTSCAPTLRKLCAADSPPQTRVMNYAFSPGGCSGGPGIVPLSAPVQDIANFLLIRGPYAFLGHGWVGCSREYEVPEQINWDYGEPVGLCKETALNSGVFEREWTKAKVSMDCNSWTPMITLKSST